MSMSSSTRFSFAAAALISLVCPAIAAEKVPSVISTWSITSLTYRILETGEESRPVGDSVSGFIQYSPGGHVVVFLQKKNPLMPSDTDFSDESRARIHREMIGAYAGRYSVNGNTVTHHIVAAWRPDWIGQDKVRYVDIQGSALTIKTAPLLSLLTGKQSVATLTFQRVE